MPNTQHLKLQQILKTINAELQHCKQANTRLNIVIQGDNKLALELKNSILGFFSSNEVAKLDNSKQPNDFSDKKPNFIIGQEFKAGFCTLDSSLDVNLIAALTGTIVGGGIWVFHITPEFEVNNDLFSKRLIKLIQAASALHIHCKDTFFEMRSTLPDTQFPDDPGIKENQQNKAIEQIIRTATKRGNRPLVITAPRGRGKSAALGIASARLALLNNKNVLVTAPSLNSATVIFKHFKQLTKDKTLTFIAPDDLIKSKPLADLLIVDEAASLPTPILKTITSLYKRVVFATTTYGYEGAGQGFKIRFTPYLQTNYPNWNHIELNTPIRWSQHDALEPLINQLFLLDSEPAEITTQIQEDSIQYKIVEQQILANDKHLLAQVSGLLQLAHYKTRPSDLKQLLANNKQKTFIATHGNKVLAVLLTVAEGPIDTQMAKQIYQGKRRPKGDIIPQSLIYHLQFNEAHSLKFLRVMRITVHPELQQQGIGSGLLVFLENYAKNKDYSAIGSTFGATPELLKFWQKNNYKLLRLGLREKASSGMHSALILNNLDKALELKMDEQENDFLERLLILLKGPLKDLEPEIVTAIFSGLKIEIPYPTHKHWQTAYDFSFLNRSFEDCINSLSACLIFTLKNKHNITHVSANFNLLISAILQVKSTEDIIDEFGFSGKKTIGAALKENIARLILDFAKQESKIKILKNPVNKS